MTVFKVSAIALILIVLAALFFVFDGQSQPAIIEWCRNCS